MSEKIILETRDLTTVFAERSGLFGARRPPFKAVDNVSLQVFHGDVFGLVGESGSGKTTLARTILGLARESHGTVAIQSKTMPSEPLRRARKSRRAVQYLHQDAAGSLDPWRPIGRSFSEAQKAAGLRSDGEKNLAALLSAVGLDASVRRRYPHELSGGQLRRVALTRILSMQPKILILDEPTAGLDLSIQASVLRLLLDLKAKYDLTMVVLSHDLSVMKLIANRIAVMYLGRIVEEGPTGDILSEPRHPYTRTLIAAAPTLTPQADEPAVLPDAAGLCATATGCAFRPRCPRASQVCEVEIPALRMTEAGRRIACHLSD